MDLGLTGRHALVLGASRGLGGAIARALALEGAHVIAASRSGKTEWSADLPPDVAARITAAQLDLTDRASVAALASHVLADGPIDILVNNSGGPPPGSIQAVEAATWDAQFAAMATHLFELARAFLPQMLARKWGRIITIASSGVEQPIPNLGISNTVRAAVVGWSKTLAEEVAGNGVTVNVVLPGRIHTTRVDELDAAAAKRTNADVAAVAAASAAAIPARRYGTPQEFADVVAFLASERASYVTGSRIRVDGGAIRAI
jgi:3-oxoacyl-[acyl-carrier protein] reductase